MRGGYHFFFLFLCIVLFDLQVWNSCVPGSRVYHRHISYCFLYVGLAVRNWKLILPVYLPFVPFSLNISEVNGEDDICMLCSVSHSNVCLMQVLSVLTGKTGMHVLSSRANPTSAAMVLLRFHHIYILPSGIPIHYFVDWKEKEQKLWVGRRLCPALCPHVLSSENKIHVQQELWGKMEFLL